MSILKPQPKLPIDDSTPHGLSVHPRGPERLKELFHVLIDEIRIAGIDIRPYLRPGLEPGEVRSHLRSRDLEAPDELVAWFGLFNGVEFGGEKPFLCFPNQEFQTLEYGLLTYDEESISPGIGNLPWEWSKPWIRITGGNVGIAVCTDESASGMLVRFLDHTQNTQEVSPSYQYVSLCSTITWLIQHLRNGAIVWNAELRVWDFKSEKMPASRRSMGIWL